MASKFTGFDVYREEAIQHHFRDQDSYSALKVSPPWTWMVFLMTGVLIAAAGIFVFVAEIDSSVRVEGFIRKDETEHAIKPADDAIYIVASLNGKAAASVHVGDMARIEMRGEQTGKPKFVQGRITRLAPWQMSHNCLEGGTAPSEGVRMALTIVPPVVGELVNLQPRVDMPVYMQLTLRKQRIIDFSRGSALK